MTQQGTHRRLSAILAADVVDYSRLMEADEAGTLAALNACRHDLIEPAAARHEGRIFKTMGDGFLVEFASVVEAVQCAVDLQAGLGSSSIDRPDAKRIRLRIGINLGDVLVEQDDLFGDGVNIAARLEAMAEPGSILLSGTVYDHLKSKIAVGFEFLGERRVKNMAEPVRVYRVLVDRKDAGRVIRKGRRALRSWRRAGIAAVLVAVLVAGIAAVLTMRNAAVAPSLPLPDKQSIAVLPFTNMSGDPEQAYFADGMTDDLITDLSQVSGLFVISRNSVFAYKGKTIGPRQVAKELGVRYVLEGSVQRAGDRVRINAQLIDTQSGGHLWADRYDGSNADIFSLQDKVTGSITDALALRLAEGEQQRLAQQETRNAAAYDAFLKGWEQFRQATNREDYAEATPYFEQAIKLDPDYGRAYAALALVTYWGATTAWNRSVGDLTAETATAIDVILHKAEKHPTSTFHQLKGLMAAGYGLSSEAIADFNQAIALDPSDSWSYAYMGRSLAFFGRPVEALQYVETAMRVDPHYPPVFLAFQGLAQFGLERYQDAAASLEQATRLNPDDSAGLLLLVATYGYLGRTEEAKSLFAAHEALIRGRGLGPTTAIFAWSTWDYGMRPEKDRLLKGLVLAGVPERLPAKPK
ncbi:MAG TPA: adenylate/guanylate cyclase domain-containing protein [Dongiaceae bacterium]